jgi:hypothetical protein
MHAKGVRDAGDIKVCVGRAIVRIFGEDNTLDFSRVGFLSEEG